MPISLEPQEKRLFWLKSDADKPLSGRPVFECHAPTRRLMRQYSTLRAEVEQNDKDAALLEAEKPVDAQAKRDVVYQGLIAMALIGVKGWRNFGTFQEEAPADALEDALTNKEIVELAYGWPAVFELNETDRKNSQSPLRSGAESSAPIAEAGPAPTNPMTTNPSTPSESPAQSAVATNNAA